MPTHPPSACNNLNAINASADRANAQPTDASRYKNNPAYKGFFLPKRSSNGPYNNCPNEMPIKKLDSDKETCAIVVCRSKAIAGKAGRYMSIEKGPMAESKPRTRIK